MFFPVISAVAAIFLCWVLPAVAYLSGADALRAVRSFALSCSLAAGTAVGLQALAGGSLYVWLECVAVAYGVAILVAHAVAMLAVIYYSGQPEPSAAAEDSYRMRCSNAAARGPLLDTKYYEYYNGHDVKDLRYAHKTLQGLGCKSFIFLCGDSSLDNKHWFFAKGATRGEHEDGSIGEDEMNDDTITAPAVNGYEKVLRSASPSRKASRMAKDVCYWLNFHAPGERRLCTIMSSVEASTAADRCEFRLLTQDKFIRDTVREEDYIIMSVGGNDIAMAPTLATVVNIALLNLSPHWLTLLGLAPGYRHLTSWCVNTF